MHIDVLTLFCEMFPSVLGASILGRALENKLLSVETHDIRSYAENKHHRVDDYAFGGGTGLVMMPQPIFSAIRDIDPDHKARRIYMSPQGKPLDDARVRALAKEENIVILCGHYEGVDQRIIDEIVDEEISIGNFVLTGGEIPACILVDAVSRLVPGVLSADECFESESIACGMLEYPQYTRPYEFHGVKVPDVLISGHHANIEKWRYEKALEMTMKMRPDLLSGEGDN